jgi:diguanylate cyclase (GGDEF)-like protein
VLALITGSFAWDQPMSSAMMVPVTLVLAVVIEGLNVLLVATSTRLAGATTWRVYFLDWRNQIAVASLALTAPIPAVLAQEEPALLPLLALAMVAAQSGMSAVSSRTALAGTDPLTSLANRATLLTRLRTRLLQLRTPADAVTLMLVDLDRFKEVNDDHGHLAGDQVLVEIARRLEESTRSSDLVARFGGDEFAILLAGGVSARNVDEVAGRIRASIARPIQVQGKPVLVGVSIGSAVGMDKGIDPLTLIHRADAALYRAKAARPPVSPQLVAPMRNEPVRHEPVRNEPAHDRRATDTLALDQRAPESSVPSQPWIGWDEPLWSRTRAEID